MVFGKDVLQEYIVGIRYINAVAILGAMAGVNDSVAFNHNFRYLFDGNTGSICIFKDDRAVSEVELYVI